MNENSHSDQHETREDRGATRAWQLVMVREIMVKLRDRAFLLGTAFTVLLIAGFMGFQAWQSEKGEDFTLAAAPDSVTMAETVAERAGAVQDKTTVELKRVDDASAARALLSDDEADAWLRPAENGDGWVLTSLDSEDGDLTAVVTEVVRETVLATNAADAGTTPQELTAGSEVTTSFLRGDADKAKVADVVGFVFVFLFYLAALLFGMQLANSVIEEKQSRIVEIIASAIPLRSLLAGKVLGNTVLALLQVGVYAAVGLIGMAFTPYKDMVPSLSGPVLWFLGFFVAGFIALSCLWAVAGALASRAEDLQNTSTPLTFLIMVMFFGGLLLEGRWATLLSFVPPFSAVLMPKRILAGDAAIWEPLLALGLLAAFAAVTIWVGERVYRRALMQTGGRVSFREAWAAAE